MAFDYSKKINQDEKYFEQKISTSKQVDNSSDIEKTSGAGEENPSNIFANSDEWNDLSEIESKQDRALGFLWKTDNYTLDLDNGIKIKSDDAEDLENIQIFENKETGEVVIIGADDVSISTNSDDIKLSIYDSNINEIKTGKGNDEIALFNSQVDELLSGSGIDDITIDGSDVDTIKTGAGADNINIKNSTSLKLNTNGGEDTVNIINSDIDIVKTGRGENTVLATESDIDKLKTGAKSDSVSLNNTEVDKLKTNKKDIVVKDGNYMDFDKSKVANINSNVEIQLQDGSSIKVEDYVSSMLNKQVSFETEEEYQQYTLETLTNNLETMKSIFQNQNAKDGAIADGYNGLKDLTGLGISDEDIDSMIAKQEEMVNGLTAALNGESNMTFEEAYEYYTGTTYSQEKIDKYLEVSNTYSAVMTACQYDEEYIEKFEKATGTTFEQLTKEYGLCQVETFGKSTTLENLSELYSQDQEAFTEKLSATISTIGMACIVTGAAISFVFPPAAGVGVALMTAGKFIAPTGMLIDNALDLVDHSTDANGLTKDEAKDLAMETGVEVVSYAVGRGIGKATNLLNNNITQKAVEKGVSNLGSKVLGQAAETIADTALSLTADFAISQGQSLITTGEFMEADDYWSMDRFLGEGKNQLIGILTGMASSKINAFQQATITGAQTKILSGDMDGAKTDLIKSGMKMSDAQFEEFTNNVKAVQTGELTVQPNNTVETEANTKAVSGEEDETSITENKETSSSPLKINLQLFANEKAETTSDEILISKSNDFIKNLLNDGEKVHSTYIKDTDTTCIRTKIGSPNAGFEDLYDTNKHILVCFDKNNKISNAFQYNSQTKEIDVYSKNGKLTHHYTKEDYDALYYYKYHPDSIHSKLRYGRDMFGGSFLEETNQVIDKLENLFSDESKVFRTTENQTLYRALQSNLSEEEISTLTTIGATYTDKSFCSTTEKIETAERFSNGNPILKINVPEDTKYIDVERLFNIDREHWSEQELLLDKNSQFVVKGLDPENNIIEVDLVQPKRIETKTPNNEISSTYLKPNIQLFAEKSTEPKTIKELLLEKIAGTKYESKFADEEELTEFVKVTNYVKNKLNDENIKISDEYLLELVDRIGYSDPSSIVQSLSSITGRNNISKAVVLNEFLKNELITESKLKEITEQYTKAGSFSIGFTDKFNSILDYLNIENSAMNKILGLSSSYNWGGIEIKEYTTQLNKIIKNIGKPEELSPEEIKTREKILINKKVSFSSSLDVVKYNTMQFENFLKLLEKNIPELSAKNIAKYSQEQFEKFETLYENGMALENAKEVALFDETNYSRFKILKENGSDDSTAKNITELVKDVSEKEFNNIIKFLPNDTKAEEISLYPVQNTDEYIFNIKKENNVDEINITIEKTLNLKTNEENICRTETYKDGTIHTYKKFSSRVLDISKNENNELINQIEIVNGTNGEPAEIIHTKASDLLKGAFETTKYTLSDYPEDMDVLKAIENGTISGGKKLSTVIKNEDGSTTYKESFEHNNCTTVRNYNILEDENGNKLSEHYKYNITDKNGNILLNIDREFSLNADGSTTTTINGKKYTSTFDNDNMIITVKDDNGNHTIIDISEKCKNQKTENKDKIWKFLKECPADTILNLEKYISSIELTNNLDSGYIEELSLIQIGTNKNILEHELGHAKDFSNLTKYSKNQELIKIYNEEMEIFKKEYPTESENFITYFGQQGGGLTNDGISEFFAETNMLLLGYGHDTEGVKTRAMILSKYFPQTIAKIGQLLNEI